MILSKFKKYKILYIIMFIIFITFTYEIFFPYDWVSVDVGPFPSQVNSYCIVSENPTGITALLWYESKIFPFAMEPSSSGTRVRRSRNSDATWHDRASIQWRESKKFGVLTQDRGGEWKIWWIEPKNLKRPSPTRFLFGNGEAVMRISPGINPQIPDNETLNRLGFRTRPNPIP